MHLRPRLHALLHSAGLLRAGLLLGLLWAGWFTWTHAVVLPGGADSSGYYNAAHTLLAGATQQPAREIAGLRMAEMPHFTYVPLGFIPSPEKSALIPTYPIGLPLLFAGSATLLGWETGPKVVIVLHALAGLLLCYLLARSAGLSPAVAALPALALAVSPVQVMFSLQAMSDVPALTWCTLALLMAQRRGPGATLAGGFAIGMAVLIRPTNALIFIPVAIALGGDGRRWLLCGLGGLPAAGALAAFNWLAYGSPLATGYGSALSTLVSLEWVPRTLLHYMLWIPVTASPLILALLAAPKAGAMDRRTLWMHAGWIVPVAAFYATYYHTHETWWYLRFLLPVYPSLLVLAAAGGAALVTRFRPAWLAALWAAAAVVILVNGVAWNRHFDSHHAGFHERLYPRAIRFIEDRVPADAVVVSMQLSGVLYRQTDYTLVRWDTLDGHWPRVRDALAAQGRPVYAALFAYELDYGFHERVPGNWVKLAEFDVVSLWKLEETAP